jgi:hypothetical protein
VLNERYDLPKNLCSSYKLSGTNLLTASSFLVTSFKIASWYDSNTSMYLNETHVN